MNATARAFAPRAVAPRPLTRVDHREDQLSRTNDLVTSLFDALVQIHRFNARERTVLHQVLLGRSSAAIARRLGLRETTVHKHMHSIHARTGTDSRQRLYDLALRLAAQRSIVQPRRHAVAA